MPPDLALPDLALPDLALPDLALPDLALPVVTQAVRLSDLPGFLVPYALAAPIFVYLLASGHILACRMRRQDAELSEEDLILVLTPRRKLYDA